MQTISQLKVETVQEGDPSGRFPGIIEQRESFGSQNLKDKMNFNNHLENYNQPFPTCLHLY